MPGRHSHFTGASASEGALGGVGVGAGRVGWVAVDGGVGGLVVAETVPCDLDDEQAAATISRQHPITTTGRTDLAPGRGTRRSGPSAVIRAGAGRRARRSLGDEPNDVVAHFVRPFDVEEVAGPVDHHHLRTGR